MITYLDRKCEITFHVAEPEGGSDFGKCRGCDACKYMKCEEVRCLPGERKDKKHKIFKFYSKVPKPRIISFFVNLRGKKIKISEGDWLFDDPPVVKIKDDSDFLW